MHETFIGGIRRNENGPYEVKLPFKNDHPLLPDKFTLCKSHLDNRLKTLKNSSLRKDRNSFPRTKQPGIIEKADVIQTEIGKTHCVPHHAVLRGENVRSVRSFRYILQGPKGHSLGQGVVDKLTKLSKIDFSVECFTAYFFFSIFYRKVSKFNFWLGEWELAIKSKYSRVFLEIFYIFFSCVGTKPRPAVNM